MRVKGADAVIANIADDVEPVVAPVVTELLAKAGDARDASLLARLDVIYPTKVLSIKTNRAVVEPAGSLQHQQVVSDIVELLSVPTTDEDYPSYLIYDAGEILAQSRPEALANAAANVDRYRPYLWLGAAAAKMPKFVGTWDSVKAYLHPPLFMHWLRYAEDAAAAIEVVPIQAGREGSSDDDLSPRQNDDKAYAGTACAGTYANMVLFAGETFVRRRRVWVKRAFKALRQINDLYYRLPTAIDIAIRLADVEPTLCRREATTITQLLPNFFRDFSNVTQIKKALEKERTAASQITIQREIWQSILNLASLVPDPKGLWRNKPLIEEEPEFFALAAYWICRLGGYVPEEFWSQLEKAVESRFASVKHDFDEFKQQILDEMHALSMAAHAYERKFTVSDVDRLPASQRALATILKYWPRLPEDTNLWAVLVSRIEDVDALMAASNRAASHPSAIDLFAALKKLPPSSDRSKILRTLLQGITERNLLLPLVDVAIDYPGDLVRWAAAFVRVCRADDCDWNAITDEVLQVRQLCPPNKRLTTK
jgi:hypothetical protein